MNKIKNPQERAFRILRNHTFYILIPQFLYTLISYSPLAAQTNNPTFQHFSSECGLTQNGIEAINQDDEGYIWLSNSDGIFRFNGHTSKFIEDAVKDSTGKGKIYASYLFSDKKGRMWILSGHDILRYETQTGKIFSLSDERKYKAIAKNNDVTCMTVDEKGTYWIGERNGLYSYNEANDSFVRYIHDTTSGAAKKYNKNRVRNIIADGHDNLWVGTLGGLFKFSLSTHQFTPMYQTKDNPNFSLDDVLSIAFDKKGKLYASVFHTGIYIIDTATNTVEVMDMNSTKGKLNSNEALNLLCDKYGNIWIGHDTKGINIYHPDTKELESYRHDESDSHSLSDDRTLSFFEDKTGMIWIGTQTEGADGVSMISPRFNSYIQHPGKANSLCEKGIVCTTEDKNGDLWIGSQDGLIYFERKKNYFTCFHHDKANLNSLSTDFIKCVLMDRFGMLWVGTNNGLNRYDSKTGKWKAYHFNSEIINSLPSENVSAICELPEGDLVITTFNGVCKYHRDGEWFETKYNNPNIKLLSPEFYIALFMDSKKTLWIATSRGGVYHLDTAFKVIHKYFYNNKIPKNMSSSKVNDIAEDKDGNIWMGTADGVNKLNPKTNEFEVYSTANGLENSMINQIKIADNGTVWAASSAGISELIFDNQGKLFVKNYNESDGLQSNVFTQLGGLKLRSGELFFGGSKGFNLFRPENITLNKLIPEVRISSFSVFDKELDYQAMYNSTKKIKLDYKQNFFSFDMAAMSFDYPEKNQYAYQLEGFDEQIIYCGNKNHVSYTNVPPGIYTLHVIASNNDGIWNTEGIRITIEIIPPYWKTLWFQIILSVAGVLVFTLMILYVFTRRLRNRLVVIEQQREIENIRSRISRDIHDEIGSGLTRISLLSEMVKSNTDTSSKDVSMLEKIIASSRQVASSLSEIIWTVNPEHDNLESLLSFMRHYISKTFEDSTIAGKINFPDEVKKIYLHPDIKRNLFLILKESLNNSIKHSSADNITVSFLITGINYQLTIVDNGIGMEEKNGNEFGNGLRNMQARARSIHAILVINSAPGKGTSVTIEGKLVENLKDVKQN